MTGALIAILLLTFGIGIVGLVLNGTTVAAYPDATPLSSNARYLLSPSLVLRQSSSYRSNDSFPRVYNWYSQRYGLGPESRAQSACIIMERSSTRFWIVSEEVAVTVCGTPNGQMIFFYRSRMITYGNWLPFSEA
jgi:hypothetical protein